MKETIPKKEFILDRLLVGYLSGFIYFISLMSDDNFFEYEAFSEAILNLISSVIYLIYYLGFIFLAITITSFSSRKHLPAIFNRIHKIILSTSIISFFALIPFISIAGRSGCVLLIITFIIIIFTSVLIIRAPKNINFNKDYFLWGFLMSFSLLSFHLSPIRFIVNALPDSFFEIVRLNDISSAFDESVYNFAFAPFSNFGIAMNVLTFVIAAVYIYRQLWVIDNTKTL